VATEEANCPSCGQPLLGRERFEGKCAACREAEILGKPPDKPVAPANACPSCGAGVADGSETCPQCGATLRGRAPSRLRPWMLAPLVAIAAALAAAVFWPREGSEQPRQAQEPPPLPQPEPARPTEAKPLPSPTAPRPVPTDQFLRVEQETGALLELAARADYERAINDYFQPDEADFGRLERALDDIVGGQAARGFADWTTRRIRRDEADLIRELRERGDPRPAFSVALLAHLAREPGASEAARRSEDRARDVLRWHLASLFDGLEVADAKPGAIQEAGPPGQFLVALRCRGQRKAAWLRDEPLALRWAKLPVGWVVKTGLADRLERLRDLLKATEPSTR